MFASGIFRFRGIRESILLPSWEHSRIVDFAWVGYSISRDCKRRSRPLRRTV